LPTHRRWCAPKLAPDNSRYAYVHAIALDSAGQTSAAPPGLEAAQRSDPANRELLAALIQYNAKLGKPAEAASWLEQLAAAAPDDPSLEQLRSLIERDASAPR
jgi:tetratricopeptide (TPR) repeat protein